MINWRGEYKMQTSNSDSHAAFVDGVRRPLDEDVPETDHEFWSSLFVARVTLEDILEIVGGEQTREST